MISIHAPLAGSDCWPSTWACSTAISIHAPLAGSDPPGRWYGNCAPPISIHAPLAGSDPAALDKAQLQWLFQSTLPSRGATRVVHALRPTGVDFNPRSPRGERLTSLCHAPASARFQSTLPSRGATTTSGGGDTNVVFQSTLPSRGATSFSAGCGRGCMYFNPRSPRGERQQILLKQYLNIFAISPKKGHNGKKKFRF